MQEVTAAPRRSSGASLSQTSRPAGTSSIRQWTSAAQPECAAAKSRAGFARRQVAARHHADPDEASRAGGRPDQTGRGAFWASPVYLGELRTDEEGRLIFLGGHGVSRPFRKGTRPLTFATTQAGTMTSATGRCGRSTFADMRRSTRSPAMSAYAAELRAGTVRSCHDGRRGAGSLLRQELDSAPARPRSRTTCCRSFSASPDCNGSITGSSSCMASARRSTRAILRSSPVERRFSRRMRLGARPCWRCFAIQPAAALGRRSGWPADLRRCCRPVLPEVRHERSNSLLAVTKTQYAHLERWAAGNFRRRPAAGAAGAAARFSALAPEARSSISSAQPARLPRRPIPSGDGDDLGDADSAALEIGVPLKVLAGEQPARQDFGDRSRRRSVPAPAAPTTARRPGCLTRFLGVPWQTDHTRAIRRPTISPRPSCRCRPSGDHARRIRF